MTAILSIICIAAILWRGVVATGVAYNRIKTRGASPTFNIIFWDSILVIVLAVSLLVKIWTPCM